MVGEFEKFGREVGGEVGKEKLDYVALYRNQIKELEKEMIGKDGKTTFEIWNKIREIERESELLEGISKIPQNELSKPSFEVSAVGTSLCIKCFKYLQEKLKKLEKEGTPPQEVEMVREQLIKVAERGMELGKNLDKGPLFKYLVQKQVSLFEEIKVSYTQCLKTKNPEEFRKLNSLLSQWPPGNFEQMLADILRDMKSTNYQNAIEAIKQIGLKQYQETKEKT